MHQHQYVINRQYIIDLQLERVTFIFIQRTCGLLGELVSNAVNQRIALIGIYHGVDGRPHRIMYHKTIAVPIGD